MMRATITKEFHFSGAHQLRGLPDHHPCSRLHGHNWIVELSVTGQIDETGMVLDYGLMAPFGKWIDENLDHRNITLEMGDVNSTAENLAMKLRQLALRVVPQIAERGLGCAVTVRETPKTSATVSD